MDTTTQYLKQDNGAIIEFNAQFINVNGEKMFLVTSEGTEVSKKEFDKQEADIKAMRDAGDNANNQAMIDAKLEAEAITEIIKEKFADEIASRVKEKKSKQDAKHK